MESNVRKSILFIINLFLSTFFVVAQDRDFHKDIIKESMNPKIMLRANDSLLFMKPRLDPLKIKTDVNKSIILKAGYNYRLDSLYRQLVSEEEPAPVLSPYLTAPYTNMEKRFLENIRPEELGFNMFGVIYYLQKILPSDDPVKPRLSKKQKALKRIKNVYNMD